MLDALKVVQDFYSLLAEGNAAAALALLSPSVAWTESERSPYYAGTVIGVEAVVATVLQPVNRELDEFAAVPAEFLAGGERIAVFGAYSGVNRNVGRKLLVPFVHSWVVSGGKLQRFTQYTDSGLWLEALGGAEVSGLHVRAADLNTAPVTAPCGGTREG